MHDAADTTVALLGRDGLPPASLDYWEDRVSSVTLGIAAPLSTGLRAAADLARVLDHADDAGRWSAAARRLDRAIRVSFGATGTSAHPDPGQRGGFGRHLPGADLLPADPRPPRGLRDRAPGSPCRTAASPRQRVGWRRGSGLDSGNRLLRALDAACGDHAGATTGWTGWPPTAHGYGSLPEQVDARGRPHLRVAPLAWTDAIVLLALAAQRHPLPMP